MKNLETYMNQIEKFVSSRFKDDYTIYVSSYLDEREKNFQIYFNSVMFTSDEFKILLDLIKQLKRKYRRLHFFPLLTSTCTYVTFVIHVLKKQ